MLKLTGRLTRESCKRMLDPSNNGRSYDMWPTRWHSEEVRNARVFSTPFGRDL